MIKSNQWDGDMIKRIINFIRHNKQKRLTLSAYFYSAYYRFCILNLKKEKLENKMGIKGETRFDETQEVIKIAMNIACRVNHISLKTPWQSKCLVRALTIQRLLKRNNISSTLYLGVGNADNNMVAHAWIRCGKYYLSGGNGDGYVVVGVYHT